MANAPARANSGVLTAIFPAPARNLTIVTVGKARFGSGLVAAFARIEIRNRASRISHKLPYGAVLAHPATCDTGSLNSDDRACRIASAAS